MLTEALWQEAVHFADRAIPAAKRRPIIRAEQLMKVEILDDHAFAAASRSRWSTRRSFQR